MLVKKYGNRRLYDTDESRYITLDELTDKVRGGEDVRVVDAKTNQDLTQATLTQIIMESRGASRLLPVPLLVQLIRLNDEALTEFLGRYVSSALELFLHARQGAQSLAPYNPFAMLPFSAASAMARMYGGANPWAEPAPPPPPHHAPPMHASAVSAAAGSGGARASDVDDLRRELDALKRTLRRKRR